MIPIPEPEFIGWLRERDISFDKEWGYIAFPGSSSDSRFWLQPYGVPRLIYLVSTLFSLLSPWQDIMLFRQGGSWIPTEGDGIIDKIRASWLSPLGLPDSGTYALRFPKKEVEQAISLLTYQQMFGMNVWDDTYAIPDHGQQLIRTSHHDVMHVEFRSSDDVAPFVQKMEEEGFDLPDHVPDETFKIPKWMQSR